MKKKILVLVATLVAFFFTTGFTNQSINYGIGDPVYSHEYFRLPSFNSSDGEVVLAQNMTKDYVYAVTGTHYIRVNNIISKYEKLVLRYSKSTDSEGNMYWNYSLFGVISGEKYGPVFNFYKNVAKPGDSFRVEIHLPTDADKDYKAPVITGTNFYKKTASETLTIKQIADALVVTDTNKTALRVSSATYTENTTVEGTYYVTFYAIDWATNISELYTVRIDVEKEVIIPKEPPIFSGQTSYQTHADAPLKVNDIKNSISATDFEGNKLQIYVITDNYTSNATRVGEHTITFNAIDKHGNQSEFIVTISVIESNFPEINGPKTLEVNADDLPTIKEIVNTHFTATHKTLGNLTSRIKVDQDMYTANIKNLGDYNVILSVTDDENHKVTHKLIITIVDTTAPVITGSSAIAYVTSSEPFDINGFKETLKVSDNHSVLENKNIYIKTDNYTYKAHEIGTYTIVFAVKDRSGNEGTFTKVVEVVEKEDETPGTPEETEPPKENNKTPEIIGIIALSLLGLIALYVMNKRRIS